MENELLQVDQFEWLRGNIMEMRRPSLFVKFRVPKEMYFDMEMLAAIFYDDPAAIFREEHHSETVHGGIHLFIEQTIEGHLRSEKLFNFLLGLALTGPGNTGFADNRFKFTV